MKPAFKHKGAALRKGTAVLGFKIDSYFIQDADKGYSLKQGQLSYG